jgi:oligoribonuclease
VLRSEHTLAAVEDELLAYIARFAGEKQGYLAGNSVHMDRAFMAHEFPRVVSWLHHRILGTRPCCGRG